MRLLALTKYGDQAASTRQRFLQYRNHLAEAGLALHTAPLLDNSYLEVTFAGRRASHLRLVAYLVRRARALLGQSHSDLIWIQKELFPFLPGFFERAVLSQDIPVVVDYDDAIFHQYDQHRSPLVRTLLGRKLEPLLRRANLAVCGNSYLEAYAGKFCRQTAVIPTVLDTAVYLPRASQGPEQRLTVGWIGSPSTWTYVEPIVPLLQSLAEELDLLIRVVGAGPNAPQLHRFEFLDWSETEEINMIQGMDIGIMPLPNEPWARGKCGYKLVQYMACGLPVVASPVGVNAEIVDDGINGFLARTDRDWIAAIRRLALEASLRRTMGTHGRAKIERCYSIQVHGPRLADMFRAVALQKSRL